MEYQLIKSIESLQEIEELIQDSELSELDEELLDQATSLVKNNFDQFAIQYKMDVQSDSDLSQLVKSMKEASKRKLEKKKDFLKCLYAMRGKIKTSHATLYQVKRSVEKVVILDFDAVMKAHPQVVTYFDEDNVRKITLNKTELKNIPQKMRRGYDVLKEEIEYPVIKIKGA